VPTVDECRTSPEGPPIGPTPPGGSRAEVPDQRSSHVGGTSGPSEIAGLCAS
jgi:hypothetical protein